MIKAERVRQIHKLAPEYARSGEYSDWLSIEHKLRSEGLHEARVELDRGYLREQLDALCKLAQSDEEGGRRSEFKEWVRVILENRDSMLIDNENVNSVSGHEGGIYASGKSYYVELRRIFGEHKLEFILTVDAPDGRSYNYGFERLEDERAFNQMGAEDVRRILNSLAERAIVRMKRSSR